MIPTIQTLGNNQIVVQISGTIWFFSYGTPIVRIVAGKVELSERYYNYSKTTSKYRNIFLNKTTKEIENSIKTGEYTLVTF